VRPCKTWYRGNFEFRDGIWVATLPDWYQTALIKGSRNKAPEE
jgi:hypothetical protein